MTYTFEVETIPVSVIELPYFARTVGKIWSEDELAGFTDFIARNPEAGVFITGTGGLRKVRWGAKGKGKRGGARVVYFFFTPNNPVFLVSIYAKSERENITENERSQYLKMSTEIKRYLKD
jgi:mRNA-degrading endonuclease RelE of RelBE toxin-antitoxin system